MTVNPVTVDAFRGPAIGFRGAFSIALVSRRKFSTEHHGLYTFLWHDYETFGADTRLDRPAQFAAIRTDAELNEIGEPLMMYCQPANDYLPDPQSCLITGITPQLCLEKACPSANLPPASRPSWPSPAPLAWATTPSGLTMRSRASCSGATSSTPMRANGRTSAAGGTCWTWCA